MIAPEACSRRFLLFEQPSWYGLKTQTFSPRTLVEVEIATDRAASAGVMNVQGNTPEHEDPGWETLYSPVHDR